MSPEKKLTTGPNSERAECITAEELAFFSSLLEDLEAEWYRFTGTNQDANDDAVDCLAYAAKILISGHSATDRNAVPMVLGGNR